MINRGLLLSTFGGCSKINSRATDPRRYEGENNSEGPRKEVGKGWKFQSGIERMPSKRFTRREVYVRVQIGFTQG